MVEMEEYSIYGNLTDILTDIDGNIHIILKRYTPINEVILKTARYILCGREVEVKIGLRMKDSKNHRRDLKLDSFLSDINQAEAGGVE